MKFQTTDTYVAAKNLSHCETVALWNSLETWKTSSIPLRCHWNPTVNSGKVPGRVLPLCWAIYMCCHFDPLFWPSEDWTQSFWLIHQHQKAHFGYQSFQNYIFLTPNSTLPRSFRVQFSAARGTPPPVSRPSTSHTPPPPPPNHPPTPLWSSLSLVVV